jgi:branched-subunit amino acid aminotransferase/4-amino-4-deoxychorismate lyase
MIKRAFIYGDLLFESMLFQNNQIEHAQKHYERLVKSAQILKMVLPENFDFEFFKTAVYNEIQNSSLINKSDCRVRFILHRNSLGFYLPDANDTDFIIFSDEAWFRLTESVNQQNNIIWLKLKPIDVI